MSDLANILLKAALLIVFNESRSGSFAATLDVAIVEKLVVLS